MTEIAWTPDQRAAIESVDRNIIVSAAAGSGKTAVLAERCAYLVCDAPTEHRCSVDELLVVTFTKAAAAEMRARVRSRLCERMTSQPHNDRLRVQVSLLNTASISTIHAFCHSLVLRWFNELDIDPSSSLLADDEARLLRVETLERVIADRYDATDACGQAFRSLVSAYGLGRDDEIARFVLRLAAFLESLPDPDQWLTDASHAYGARAGVVVSRMLAALRREIELQRNDCRSFHVSADEAGAGVGFYQNLIADHAGRLETWASALNRFLATHAGDSLSATDAAWTPVDQTLKEIADCVMNARGGPRRNPDASEAETIALEAAKATYKRMQGHFAKRLRDRFALFSAGERIEGLTSASDHARALIDLTASFCREYSAAKRSLDVLDFADLERYAFQLLSNKETADRVRERYKHVLVDEYQDVNRLQAELLQRISQPNAADHPGHLFTVGDVKQSIYRFRTAEPRIFLERFDRCGRDSSNGARIHLRENFRSRRTILDGVNHLFSVLMRRDVAGMDYTVDDELKPGRSFDPATWCSSIDVHLLDRDASPGDSDDSPDYVDHDDPAQWESVEREAFVMAKEIRQLLEGGVTLQDGKTLEPSDIAVLLRAPAFRADLIAKCLTRNGVNAYSETPGSMFDTTEIQDIRALLEVLDNARQDIPLAALLRSTVLGTPFSEDDLVAIRCLDRDAPFHECVQRYPQEGDDEALRARLVTLLRRIARYRQAMRVGPFSDVLATMLDETGYLAYVCGLPNGTRRRANLLRFVERSRAFDQSHHRGLHGFLRFVETLEQDDRDLGAAAETPPSSAVRIMSIHGSKGLEFPIVFVADLGRRFNLGDTRGRTIFERSAGVGLKVVDQERMIEYPTAAHALAATNITAESLAEELRILYVAMTRAKEKLFLVGSTSLSAVERTRTEFERLRTNVTCQDIATAGSPLDWLTATLAAASQDEVDWSPHKDSETLFRMFLHDRDDMAKWRVDASEQSDDPSLRQTAARLDALPPNEPRPADPLPAERVMARVRFDYPYLAAASVPVVVAASAAERLAPAPSDPDVPAPEFFARTPDVNLDAEPTAERENAKLRGIATHAVLQHLDFTIATDIAAITHQMTRMVDAGLLTRDQSLAVDADAIAWFVGTRLGQAIQSAGVSYRREFMFVAHHPAHWFDPTLGPAADERVLVRGIVDGVLDGENGLEVIDFKTDRLSKKDVPQGVQRHRRQLQLYAASVGPLFGRDVSRCWLVFLHPRVVESVSPRQPETAM